MNNSLEKSSFEKLVKRFLSNESDLSVYELNQLKGFFSSEKGSSIVEQWFVDNWNESDYDDVDLSFSSLRNNILNNKKQRGISFYVSKMSHYYQKVAAILILPVLFIGLLYMLFKADKKDVFYLAEAPLGQKAKIELVDGSVVWLNSGTTIKYSSDFNLKGRDIYLNGEAFFDVKKNTDRPFFVHTEFIDIEVTGTKFNVQAYRDEAVVKTALVEGSINLLVKGDNKKYSLTSGKFIEYKKKSGRLVQGNFTESEENSWTDNRLVFINDSFPKLKRKIERWYNMEVIYDSLDFVHNKLTVSLEPGEQLNKLLDIIEVAIEAECIIKENKIIITKKDEHDK